MTEESYTLAQLTGAPRRSRGPLIAIVALSTALVLVGGAFGIYVLRDDSPTGTPAAAATTNVPTSSPLPITPGPSPLDKLVVNLCEELKAMQGKDDMFDPVKMQALGDQLASTFDPSFRSKGRRLSDQARLALAAKGGPNELSTTLEMSTTALETYTMCIERRIVKP